MSSHQTIIKMDLWTKSPTNKLKNQRHLRFSQRWRFKSRSSGLWRRVVM